MEGSTKISSIFGFKFIEFQVHSRGHSLEELVAQAKRIQAELGIEDTQLVPYSYLELYLLQRTDQRGRQQSLPLVEMDRVRKLLGSDSGLDSDANSLVSIEA